jgi:hypothetical protein
MASVMRLRDPALKLANGRAFTLVVGENDECSERVPESQEHSRRDIDTMKQNKGREQDRDSEM